MPAESTGGLERPPMMRNDLPNVNERPLERPNLWSDAIDDVMMERSNHVVRFNDDVEVHTVPNVFNTYSMAPKDFVIGKNGKFIMLTRHHDHFTGASKVEVRERRKIMSKACRWSF